MTDDEIIQITRLLKDVEWLKIITEKQTLSNTVAHNTIISHLETLSTAIAAHNIQIKECEIKGKENRALIIWIGSGVVAVAGLIILFVLKHIGFPI